MPKMHSLNNSQVLMPHWFTIWDDCYPWSNLNQLKRRSRRIGVFLGSHLLNNIPVAKKKVYSPTTWVRTRWKIVALQQVARFARCFWVSVAPCIGCISRHQISNKISIKKTCSFNYTWSLCSKKDVHKKTSPTIPAVPSRWILRASPGFPPSVAGMSWPWMPALGRFSGHISQIPPCGIFCPCFQMRPLSFFRTGLVSVDGTCQPTDLLMLAPY